MDLAQSSGEWVKAKPRKSTRLQREARIGLLFISPWLIGFILLKALPILAALIFSLARVAVIKLPITSRRYTQSSIQPGDCR